MLAPVLLAALLAAPLPKFTDTDRQQKLEAAFPEVDRIFEKFHQERLTPGLVYGIVIDGRLARLKAYGDVTPDMQFRIASMTKSFTALAVLKLRDEGKLSLADPVSKWIPEFARMEMPTRDSPPIRVRDLLMHTSGFPEDNPWGDQQLGITDEQLTEWLKKGIPFSTAPGTTWEYSNYGFALAGRVVQAASGRPYRDYVEKEILAPLGMKSSTLEPSAATKPATGYRPLPDGKREVEPSLRHGAFGAMGGMVVSPEDMGRYVAFMLSAFPPRDEADNGPVSRASVREMQQMWFNTDLNVFGATPDRPLTVATAGYGYGLRIIRNCHFRHIAGHGGGLPGFGSYMQWLPEHGVGLFAMANLTYAGPVPAINQALDVLRKTGALKPRELPPSPALISTRDAIAGLWQNWDQAKADSIAAMNLFLDIPAAHRRAGIDRIKARVGACKAPSAVEPENWLRGTFHMPCERGTVYVTFTLAPTEPPSVQYLRFDETRPTDNNLCRP